MKLSETKYNKLLLTEFKGDKNQLHTEFVRVIEEHGYSEEIKIDFYKAAFNSLMNWHKTHTRKDEFYYDYLINLYVIFINALEEDEIDTSDIEAELEEFKTNKIPIYLSSTSALENRNYNPNTKYGRKKAREQALRNYENGTPEYRKEQDNIKVWAMVILIIGVVIFYWLKSKFMK
ncbi:hypothetical protein C3L50_03220 [Flavobacterium alvei]|uniref:Uncharacterized protein n=1 Tax=Flavobacterium alvei TaxID=2080416 RepID=A0A2S5ADC9_9FLAO|nr:hypothetical protein [Flavobacterium alvei]POY40526.1 hypothetical protein C3L50_03220 [Flavobacterium alvei]